MPDEPRVAKRPKSHPELEARGWERDEPTQVIDKTLSELTRTVDQAESVCGVTAAFTRRSNRKLARSIGKVLDKTGT